MLKFRFFITIGALFLLGSAMYCLAGNIAQPFSNDNAVQPVINGPEGIDQLNDIDANSLALMLINFRNWFAGIVLILSTLSVLIAAFLYMTSGGDQKKSQKALGWLKGAIIGVLVATVSFGIGSLVIKLIVGLSQAG